MTGRSILSGRRRVVAAVSALFLAVATGFAPPSQAQTAPVVVSFTVDDGTADQMAGAAALAKHGMRGTFYVISGVVDTPGYLTRADVGALAAAGHEIGGHTVSHADLTTIPPEEAKRQICTDRAQLTGWGYQVTSFAYPFTAYNDTTRAMAAECGYNSARTLGDIRSPHGCADCDTAETVPPIDPFTVRAPDMIDPTWTLADLQSVVTQAESSGGGWVPFVLHQTCDGCSELAISPALLDQFAGWLAERGTAVKTVHEVVGGETKPVVTVPPGDPSTTLTNPSLETPGTAGFPSCWMPGGWGTNKPVWTSTTDARTGSNAQRLDVTEYTDGDAKLLPTFDLGTCSPSAAEGRSYTLGAWYKSTGLTQLAVYFRNQQGGWQYFTSSPWFGNATEWTQASWRTPPLPAGATGISFGLAMISVGSLTTDDYSIQE